MLTMNARSAPGFDVRRFLFCFFLLELAFAGPFTTGKGSRARGALLLGKGMLFFSFFFCPHENAIILLPTPFSFPAVHEGKAHVAGWRKSRGPRHICRPITSCTTNDDVLLLIDALRFGFFRVGISLIVGLPARAICFFFLYLCVVVVFFELGLLLSLLAAGLALAVS